MSEQDKVPTYEQQLARATQEFMSRTDLKGREVDTYAKAYNLINELASGTFGMVPVAEWNALTQEVLVLRQAVEGNAGETLTPPVWQDPVMELDAVDSENESE